MSKFSTQYDLYDLICETDINEKTRIEISIGDELNYREISAVEELVKLYPYPVINSYFNKIKNTLKVYLYKNHWHTEIMNNSPWFVDEIKKCKEFWLDELLNSGCPENTAYNIVYFGGEKFYAY